MLMRSDSGSDLLKAPDMSVPFKMNDFKVHGIGGGFIVVNHYGDNPISVASVEFGVLGETWESIDVACMELHRSASLTSTKCSATGLKIGGAGILLYFDSADERIPENRKLLLSGLAAELENFTKTNVLCLPCSLEKDDLVNLYKANEKLKLEAAERASDEKKTDADEEGAPRKRKTSFATLPEDFEFPVPAGLITEEALSENVVAKSAAHSAFGSIVTLAKAENWFRNRVVLMGITEVSKELYALLSRETDTVFLSDPDPSKCDDTKIPPRAILSWDKALAKDNKWDVIVFCSKACPILDESMLSSIRCKAILSISDDKLPVAQSERETIMMELQKRSIFESLDGMSDLGEIAKVYSICEKSTLTFTDAFELGSTIMRKKLHLHGIITSDDVNAKRKFHDLMLHALESDENARLFGLGTVMHQSSDRMTDWLWARARGMCPAFRALSSSTATMKPDTVNYLDLGAGNGSAARFICKQDKRIHITCVDVDPKQSAENRNLSDEEGMGNQIEIQLGSFERLNSDYSNWFDGCMSQDAFIHAFDKLHAFKEAFRVTKGGGWLVISDLMRGDGKNLDEEIEEFVIEHGITDWTTPSQCVDMATTAGWAEVKFIDCTAEIRVSLQGLLQKIKEMVESGDYEGRNLQLLQTHRQRLSRRIGKADRGVFKWGIIAARKPYDVVFYSTPPVTPEPRSMMNYSVNDLDGDLKFGTDVLVVNIKEKLPRSKIMALPSTTRLIVTLSAGLDHIDVAAADERGIRIRRAAREQIVKSVADYLLSNIIFGLRNGFQNVGVPFPGASWDLTWNADGVDLDDSKIGFVGMGAIAAETAKRIRALSNSCELVYHVPGDIRCRFEEGTHHMYHVGIADLLSTCDVIVPMVPLTESTAGLINYSSFHLMKKTAVFINMARGKVVDTGGLTKALEEGLVRHAILDTTDPEPLPKDHTLWNLPNCTITPHFATNTTYVRKELVEDIPNQVEDTLEERGILRLEEQRMRLELSDAYRLTREFGLDELVWNHISVLLSDGNFLITPGSRMFDDIGPNDLVKSSGNITANIIHEAVYNTRSDVKAIVHLHTPATVAVSCLEMGFVPLAQEAAPFVGRVSRHPWHGVSNDREEQALLADAIKDESVNTLLMENHGFACFGKTLGEAWVLAFFFDKACRTQLNCLQTGQKIKYPDPAVLAKAAEQAYLPDFFPGNCEWDALRKMLTRKGNATEHFSGYHQRSRTMISALAWVPAGVADPNPKKYELSAVEMELVEMMEKQNFSEAKELLEKQAGLDTKETGSKIKLPKIENNLPADLRMDEYSSDEDENDAVKNAHLGNLLMSNEDMDEQEYDALAGNQQEKEGMDSEASDDDDDDDDDLADVPDTREFTPLDMEGFTALGISQVGTNAPAYMMGDDEDDDDESEKEDVQIQTDDAIVVIAKTEDDFATLEVHVYEPKMGNLFVHHDIPLPSFPLCLAHGDISPTGAAGNFCAVGTFSPGIEIWNLDVLNALDPSCVLGGEDTTFADEIMKHNVLNGAGAGSKMNAPKFGGQASLKPGSHMDAVMSLSWNTIHRQVIASGSADCTVKLWDVTQASSNQCNAATFSHHKDKVQSVLWHPQEGTLLATGSYDRTVALVDARSQENVKRVKLPSDCEGMAWDPFRPQYLTVACEDGTLKCWDVRKFSDKTPAWSTVVNEFGGVSDLSYNPNVPGLLATCSVDKTVSLWDTHVSEEGAKQEPPKLCGNKEMNVGKLYTVGFYPSAPWIMGCAGAGKELAIWDMTREDAIQKRFGSRVTGNNKVQTSSDGTADKEAFDAMMSSDSNTAPKKEEVKSPQEKNKKKKGGKKKSKAHKAGR
eukprot:Nitzschia sp. Nitz4//scaffold190_size42200//21271//27280//NITZ4_007392-RA/size42200-processed-gene-0.51-mRNA-1//-1//CDS//3329540144//27//frame0